MIFQEKVFAFYLFQNLKLPLFFLSASGFKKKKQAEFLNKTSSKKIVTWFLLYKNNKHGLFDFKVNAE